MQLFSHVSADAVFVRGHEAAIGVMTSEHLPTGDVLLLKTQRTRERFHLWKLEAPDKEHEEKPRIQLPVKIPNGTTESMEPSFKAIFFSKWIRF